MKRNLFLEIVGLIILFGGPKSLNGAEMEVPDRLSVDGASIFRNTVTINGLLTTSGNVYIGTTAVIGARLAVIGSPNTAYSFSVGTSAAYSLVVSTGGSVGIGTTAPARKLEVSGDLSANAIYQGTSPVLVASMLDNFTLKLDTTTNTIKLADRIEQNIMLDAFKIAVGSSLSKFNLVDGVADEFQDQSGIDTSNSINQSYDSANNLYTTSLKNVLDYMEYANNTDARNAYVSNDANLVYGSDAIPAMTSWTAPSGVASALSEYNGNMQAWRAFDDTNPIADQNCWSSNASPSVGSPQWLQYQFPSAKLAREYTVTARHNSSCTDVAYPTQWTFLGSTDGSTWIPLDTRTGQTFGCGETKSFTFANSNSYAYYRINITGVGNNAGSYVTIGEMEIMEVSSEGNLVCYSEATTKTQGAYSLKAVAKQTASINDTLTRTLGTPLDLTNVNKLFFDIRASLTGGNIKAGIHDSDDGWTEITPNILSANNWQTISWDISAVTNPNKSAIDKIALTVVNAPADNTFYVDNFITERNNMTVLSAPVTAVAKPNTVRLVISEEDIDSVQPGTDLRAYASIDNGTNFDEVTLADEGCWAVGKRILSGIVDVTSRTGTSVRWKIQTFNNKNLKLHAAGMNWD